MAEQKGSVAAEELAVSIIKDLGDANHPIWLTGTPGLSRNPWDRFSPATRDEILARLTRVIEEAS